ncbi:MAG: dTMP kinase [Clostridia bacterium]|nr:dTMP kinase [Clostridia bacterium]
MGNKFIVIEGLDGSGKSTQIKLLADYLTQKGEKVYITAEPQSYETGAYIRRILSESLDKDMYLQAALFLADRLEHITHPALGIKKHLEDGETVICDRYYYSSFAYQGTASQMDWVMDINLKCPEIITPDLCIFLDVNPNTCKERIDTTRESAELYEKDTELMSKIRQNFLDVFEKLRDRESIKIISADRGIEEIQADIIKAIQEV